MKAVTFRYLSTSFCELHHYIQHHSIQHHSHRYKASQSQAIPACVIVTKLDYHNPSINFQPFSHTCIIGPLTAIRANPPNTPQQTQPSRPTASQPVMPPLFPSQPLTRKPQSNFAKSPRDPRYKQQHENHNCNSSSQPPPQTTHPLLATKKDILRNPVPDGYSEQTEPESSRTGARKLPTNHDLARKNISLSDEDRRRADTIPGGEGADTGDLEQGDRGKEGIGLRGRGRLVDRSRREEKGWWGKLGV